jgi:excinuclease Cho
MQVRITSAGLVIAPNPADTFEYPHHIDRASLDALPSKPGIYIFRDAQDRPLYIGKSINIRTRVLSHLRTPEEARMLQQSRHVEFRRTAGEIGALLLESQLIKEQQPLYNKKLRRTREMCTLRLDPGKKAIPEIVYARDHDFAKTANLYGLFATRKAALEQLRAIVEMEKLCPALTGLEPVTRGRAGHAARACFARQISRCLGACIGEEPIEEHERRLRNALEEMRIIVWPYPGPMGIVEECEGWRQTHVIDHWFYIRSIDHATDVSQVQIYHSRTFDIDTYKILVKPMVSGALQITPLTVEDSATGANAACAAD